MSAQDCARCDHAMSSQALRQPADERGEDRSIRPVRYEALDSLSARRQLRGAVPGARRPWTVDERPNNNSRFSSRRKTR